MRLFVALDLPEAVRGALPSPGEPWRAVPGPNLHVTVVFIGRAEAVPALREPPPTAPLRLAEVIVLPPSRPRVLAVRCEDPTGLHTAFQARLARTLDRVEDRPWLPHITIARLPREAASRHRTAPAAPAAPEGLEFVPPGLTLYRSAGGRYEVLERLEPAGP